MAMRGDEPVEARQDPLQRYFNRQRTRLLERMHRGRLRLAQLALAAPAKWADLFTVQPMLEARHVEACRVLPSRDVMIRQHLPKRAVVAEVGVSFGDNARTILQGTDPRELHLIDQDLSRLKPHLVEPSLQHGTVRLHEQDSAAALASFPDEHFDWIYIDGDHSFEGVSRDIEQAKKKIKREGLLIFNDYIFFSHRELAAYGVVHAVNELCLAEGWGLRYFAFQGEMYCDVAVARLGG